MKVAQVVAGDGQVGTRAAVIRPDAHPAVTARTAQTATSASLLTIGHRPPPDTGPGSGGAAHVQIDVDALSDR